MVKLSIQTKWKHSFGSQRKTKDKIESHFHLCPPESERLFSLAKLLNMAPLLVVRSAKSFSEHFNVIPSIVRQFGNFCLFWKGFHLCWGRSYTRGQLWFTLGRCDSRGASGIQPGSRPFSPFNLFGNKLFLLDKNERMSWVSGKRLENFNPVEYICFRYWSNFPFAPLFL